MPYYNQGKKAPKVARALAPSTGQGSPAALAQAWPVEITDGTSILGTPAHPLEVAVASEPAASDEDGINRRLLEATALRERDLVRLSLQTRAGERIVTSYERGVR